MLTKTAAYLANRLLSHGTISKDELDIYVYGFELLLSFTFSTTLIMIAGCIMGKALETVAFLTVFILLRSFSGGYHSDTYGKCFILTFLIYAMTMIISDCVKISWIFYIPLLIIGTVVLFIKAPIENPNKELTDQEAKRHKLTSIILFTLFCLSGICVNVFSKVIGTTVYVALVTDLVLLFVKTNYKNHERRN